MIDSNNNQTDEELVRLTLEDPDYFAFLVERYEHKFFRYIRRISSVNIEEAEDLLQESFIKMYTNLNSFDSKLKFSSWSYRIVHNTVISHYRKLKNKGQEASIDDFDNNVFNQLVSDLDMKEELDSKYLCESINKVLKKIDIKYREVLVLKFLEELSYEEISDVLKKPTGTIGTLINRAKKKFKEEYSKMSKEKI